MEEKELDIIQSDSVENTEIYDPCSCSHFADNAPQENDGLDTYGLSEFSEYVSGDEETSVIEPDIAESLPENTPSENKKAELISLLAAFAVPIILFLIYLIKR